jgi:hypothetical protein
MNAGNLQSAGGVAYFAHVGGFIAGMLLIVPGDDDGPPDPRIPTPAALSYQRFVGSPVSCRRVRRGRPRSAGAERDDGEADTPPGRSARSSTTRAAPQRGGKVRSMVVLVRDERAVRVVEQ